MDDKHQITHDHFCEINILASKVNAIGEFFSFIEPREIIGDGQELYHNFGEILCDAANGIHQITNKVEEAEIRQRKNDTAPISEQ
jgi:hypothetical protein